jgi:hypothetical protein
MIPLIESGNVKGILTEDTLLASIVSKKLTILSSASKALTKDFMKVFLFPLKNLPIAPV